MLTTLFAGLFMIGLLVVVHELGHALVARFVGVEVPVFSVGMGPRLFGFYWRGTDWRVSAFPVGGYVQMAGSDMYGEEDISSEVSPERSFMNKPVWQRLLIALAGPAANLMLPFVLFVGVLMLGEPSPDNRVGHVDLASPAETIGFEAGDQVLSVDGHEVEVWEDVFVHFRDNGSRDLKVEVARAERNVALVVPKGTIALDTLGGVDSWFGLYQAYLSSRVGVDDPTSPAGRAGLQTGDAIVGVDGVSCDGWHAMQRLLKPGTAHALDVRRVESGELNVYQLTLTPDADWAPREGEVGPSAWGLLPADVFVSSVRDGGPAEEAGLEPGDRVWAVDNVRLSTWSQMSGLIAAASKNAEDGAVRVDVVRKGEMIERSITPMLFREIIGADVRHRPVIGVSSYSGLYLPGAEVQRYYSFGKALDRASDYWVRIFQGTMKMLGNMVTGATTMKESVGGPVAIFQVASQTVEQGWFMYAKLMAQISFSLGIINLLPVPVLDGGQIVFYTLEAIRGRPLPLVLRERIQMVGVLFMMGLMLLVTVMDVSRLFDG